MQASDENLSDAFIHDSFAKRWRRFFEPLKTLATCNSNEVSEILIKAEDYSKNGYFAVGFISYEAATAFHPKLSQKDLNHFPKVFFIIYKKSDLVDLPDSYNNFYLGPWNSELSKSDYYSAISKIKNEIKAGNTYQTNFTFRLQSKFIGNTQDCFLNFVNNQSAPYGGLISFGDFSICSASPELFFTKVNNQIITKPMKGTCPRSDNYLEDQSKSKALIASEKERSENVMIVDLLRNDLSLIAEDNSVRATSLFDLEAYKTLWQMTSTVEARSSKSLSEIITAIFPSASITGAPKLRTMQIINQTENSPRGIYTGALGFMLPNQIAQFNVAIRTIVINKKEGIASYGIGSGIVWDCDINKEFEECLLKSKATPNSDIELLETLLWERNAGFFLLDLHLKRLSESCNYFNFPFNHLKILDALEMKACEHSKDKMRVRLLLDKNGDIKIEWQDLNLLPQPYKISLSKSPIDSKNIYLKHKTTNRKIYQDAQSSSKNSDDVILWNEKGEITESCIGNIAFRLGNNWYTPKIESGLLNGVYRQYLINNRILSERTLLKDDIKIVDEIAVINSLRKWIKQVELI